MFHEIRGEILNTLRRLIWPTLYLLSTIGLAQAKGGDRVIAIVIDDSSSMSVDNPNDPKGDAARAAASRVFLDEEGTKLGYFTFGSATIQGSKPLVVVDPVPADTKARKREFERVMNAILKENVKIARKAPGASTWGSSAPHPYWGDQTPCIPALEQANNWLQGEKGAKQVFFLTDGECLHVRNPKIGRKYSKERQTFNRTLVSKILGNTPIDCRGLGSKFTEGRIANGVKPFIETCKAIGKFARMKADDFQGTLLEMNRRLQCNEGGEPHPVGSGSINTDQAMSVSCFGKATGAASPGDTVNWRWPNAVPYKDSAVQGSGFAENQILIGRHFGGKNISSEDCEKLIESGQGVTRPTFDLGARIDWWEGPCSEQAGPAEKGQISSRKKACLKAYFTVDLPSGQQVPATKATLKAYTASRLTNMEADLGINKKIWGQGKVEDKVPYWNHEVVLSTTPKTFEFKAKPPSSVMDCTGPMAINQQELKYDKPSSCTLERTPGKKCDFSDEVINFGVVSDKVDKVCTFTLKCQGNDPRPVTYEVQAASNDQPLAQDCFTFEVNQKQLTFDKGQTRQVRFTLGPPNDRDACDRELTRRGRATYDVPMRLAAGKDELNFTLKAVRRAGLSIQAQAEWRDEQSPLSWQGSGRHAQPLKISLGYTGLRSGESVHVDVKDIKVRVSDAQDSSSLINLENRLAKRFDHEDAWWRHEVDQPATSYRWVRCKKDPKTEEYVPVSAVVIGGDADPEVCIQLTERLDRCARGGFFNLCDQTNEPVTFELSAFRKVVDGKRGAIQNPKSGHTATAQLVIHRGWFDWFFAGPGLWWIWLLNPLGFFVVVIGLRSTATNSFQGLFQRHAGKAIFWILWLVGTAVAIYLHLAD